MRLACTGLFSWFEKSATVVTSSPVLAKVAARQFSAYQIEQHIESWQRPPIYSIEPWLEICWKEARYSQNDVPALLSPQQERVLWQRIIEREQPDLFHPKATAGLAVRAAKIMAEWRIPLESDLWNDHQDAQQFVRWLKLFRRKCHREGWITRSDLWSLLPSWIANGLCSPAPTVFVGFGTITPALETVKHALTPLAQIEDIVAVNPLALGPVKSCTDFSQEIEQAARWARARFEEEAKRSIGVFVPDLPTHRALIERTFHRVFYPSTPLSDASDLVFHVNTAAPLENHPLAAGALLLLELARPRIDQEDACAILRCPFITGAAAERSARALADLELRRRRELDVSLRDLEIAARDCPLLTPVWSSIRRVLQKKAHLLELPAWSGFIRDLLNAAGWPGDSKLTLREEEVLKEWEKALSTLAALGLVSAEVSYEAALYHLRRLVSTGGLERGDWSSPIQVLDSSDAPGLAFDCAFLTGLSSETWPQPVRMSPLIPLKLQRTQQVPGSSPQSAQRESESATESLFRVAPILSATYSGRLSSLAEKFVTQSAVEFPLWEGKLPRQSYTPTALDEMEDGTAPPYMGSGETRGGASLIKSQSLCPFRAFAEFRLAARSPEEACLGFDSRDRGGFVHKALQNIWNRMSTQRELLGMPSEELRALVREAVNGAVRDSQSSPFYKLAGETERERLEELVLEWLNLERGRKQPFTVEMVEEDRWYEIPGLRLHLRVDRMDRLKNGKLVLIDYKSGKQSREKLKCPRPAEPQLLVYAAAVGSDVDGVFFGEVKAREVRAVGFSRERHFSGSAAQERKNWGLFLAESREEVRRIAQEFVEGHAAVDPVHKACEYCAIAPFCRVNESAGKEQEDE